MHHLALAATRYKTPANLTRILQVIKCLGLGGAEQLLAMTATHLDSRFECEVAYLVKGTGNAALVGELTDRGWFVHCLSEGMGSWWLPRLGRLIDRGDFDLVHIHSPYVAVGARLTLRRRLPVLYTEHSNWQGRRAPTRWANAVTFPLNDRVLTVSDGVRRSLRYPFLLRILPTPPAETLYQGIDLERLRPRPESRLQMRQQLGIDDASPLVGTIANFRPLKGYPHLLEVAKRVLRRRPDAHFVAAGYGPLKEEIRAMATKVGLSDKVIFPGYQTDVVPLLAALDVFILTSLSEGLPIALLEAMAIGKAVVATRVGGIEEVISNDVNGFLADSGDVEVLSAAVLRLLEEPELKVRIERSGQHRARQFDIRTTVRRLESVYDEMTQQRRRPRR